MRWTDINEIAEALNDSHPDTPTIINVSLRKIHMLTTNLLGFDDDPARSNERILESIKSKWIEYREEDI